MFEALNQGDAGPLVAGLGTPVRHAMYGEHPLSGVRSDATSIVRWYERLFRLFPDLRFDLDTIAVTGRPSRTKVFVEWQDRALDGRYENRGVNMIELRWGRVHAIDIHCDTQHLAAAIEELARQGVEEAQAAPIADDAPSG